MQPERTPQTASSKAKAEFITPAEILFLVAAFISFLLSVFLWFMSNKEQGLFVGIWVPSIISLGCFFQNMVLRHQGNKRL